MWALFYVAPTNGKQYYLFQKGSSNNKAIIFKQAVSFQPINMKDGVAVHR